LVPNFNEVIRIRSQKV